MSESFFKEFILQILFPKKCIYKRYFSTSWFGSQHRYCYTISPVYIFWCCSAQGVCMHIWFFPKYEVDMGIETMWVHVLIWLETDSLSNPWVMFLCLTWRQDSAEHRPVCSSHVQTGFVLEEQAHSGSGFASSKGGKKGFLSNYPQHLPLHVSHHNVKKTL